MHNLVDIIRCHARTDFSGGYIEHFSGNGAHLPHGCLALCIQHLHLILPQQFPLGLRYAIARIVRTVDALWYTPPGRERVYWAQGASKLKFRERIVEAVYWFRRELVSLVRNSRASSGSWKANLETRTTGNLLEAALCNVLCSAWTFHGHYLSLVRPGEERATRF
jgi:hypothetical protein